MDFGNNGAKLDRKPERRLTDAQFLDLMNKAFARNQSFPLQITGVSMLPTVAPHRDRVILVPLNRPLRRQDVALYRRQDGTIVLHRVVRIHPDGSFDCRGDNQLVIERGLQPGQVLALAEAFVRKGKSISPSGLGFRLWSGARRFVRRGKGLLLGLLPRKRK